ncbi:MAG: type IV pilin N-terminal domain-containing protein [Halanaeroarchaeum sp.]
MIAKRERDRGVSPAVGTVAMVLVTVGLVVAGSTVVGSSALDPPEATSPVMLSVSVDDSGRIELSHDGGPPVDVGTVSVHVVVDGRPLEDQPPVPFFSASGFASGPTGAFNSASDDRFEVGETTSFTVAGTNAPTIEAGSSVTVDVRRDGRILARAETSATGGPGDGDEG